MTLTESTSPTTTTAPAGKKNAINGSSNGQTPPPAANGRVPQKKKTAEPPDPVTMYESVRSRIAALEEEEGQEEEEDRKMAEEAHSTVRGMSDSAIHSKYVDLYQEMKRNEREHAKERQKLTKDKDSAKSQLTKANQSRTKLENLARELQKDNKRLREDSKRLLSSVEDAQEVIQSMKSEIERRVDDVKSRRDSLRDQLRNPLFPSTSHTLSKSLEGTDKPDSASKSEIILKVVCKYRAELFFKVSRKTKLGRLFGAWTDRMERLSFPDDDLEGESREVKQKTATPSPEKTSSRMAFMFSYHGKVLDGSHTAEDAGIEGDDTILAVEVVDLTEDVVNVPQEEDVVPTYQRERLKKHWTDDPDEAKRAVEEIFDTVIRSRLGALLLQYEEREQHFAAIMRSKELEVMLAKARADEQKHLAEVESGVSRATEAQNVQLQKSLENIKAAQSRLMDKLIACCKEPAGDGAQRLFSYLRDELKKRGNLDFETPPGVSVG